MAREDDSPRRRSSRDEDDSPRRSSRGRDDDTPRRSSRDSDDAPRGRGRDEDTTRRSSRSDESRSSGRYEYHARSREQVDRRAQGTSDFDVFVKDTIKMYKAKDGLNTVRILPPTWNKPEHFGLDVHVHYGIGPDRQTYLCLDKHKGEPCPVCEERADAKRDGDDDYAQELRANTRTLVYLIDRDNEKDGVQAYAMPATLDQAIVKVSVDRKTGDVLPIDHPEDGYDVEFEKTGAKMKTKYVGVAIARRSSPLGKPQWLDFALDNPLDEQLVFYPYDHIAKVFGAKGPKPSRDEDDAPRGRGRDDEPRGRGGRDEDPDPRERGGRGREEPRRSRDEPKEPTFEDVMAMSGDELEKIIDDMRLEINPNKASSDEELAEWVCEDLKLSPSAPRRREAPKDDAPEDRLARMRRDREAR